jgi:hypothetical protein
MKSFYEFLSDNSACSEALTWTKGRSLVWGRRHCSRPDWMVWYINELDIRGIKVDIKPLRKLVKKWKKSSVFSQRFDEASGGMSLKHDINFLRCLKKTMFYLYDPCWMYKLTDGEEICDDIRLAYPIAPDWRG